MQHSPLQMPSTGLCSITSGWARTYLLGYLQAKLLLHSVQQPALAAGVEHALLDAAFVARHGVDEDCEKRAGLEVLPGLVAEEHQAAASHPVRGFSSPERLSLLRNRRRSTLPSPLPVSALALVDLHHNSCTNPPWQRPESRAQCVAAFFQRQRACQHPPWEDSKREQTPGPIPITM